jgi:hypothetical protein
LAEDGTGGAHGVRKTTYYWKQTFPAHQETVIEHRYTPIVSRGIPIQDEEMRKYQLKEQKRYQQKYCMDKDSLDARIRIGATEHALEYILTTGANWSGPIRDFRLVIDKGAADNIVQFCMREPIKKIRPTQFEVHVHNFLRTSNLRILFILPPNQTQREMDGSNAKIDTGLPPSQAEPTRGGNEPPTPQRLDTSGQRTSIGKCRGFPREHAYQLLDAAWRSLRLIRPKRPRIGGVSSG